VDLNECRGVVFNGSIFGSCVLNSSHTTLKNANLISDSFFQTNSAKILSGNDGSTYVVNCLPDYVPQWMQAYALDHDLGMCSYLGTQMLCGTACTRYLDYEARINGLDVVQTPSFEPHVHTDFYKVLLSATPTRAAEHEKRLAHRFMGRLSIYRSEPYFIEVMPRGVNKASAIAGLLERLGLEREDTIACGDGLNDLSMIRYAGLGVAMGNAQPEVKAAADVVTRTNDEDGIVPIIEQYILRED
jgi:Cof subfamily protein (haloacid dehalogenase superfamily)